MSDQLFGEGEMDAIGIKGAVQRVCKTDPCSCEREAFTPAEAEQFMDDFLDWLSEKGLGFGGGFERGEDWPYKEEPTP